MKFKSTLSLTATNDPSNTNIMLSIAQALDNPQIISFCLGEEFGCAAFSGLGFKCFGTSTKWGMDSKLVNTGGNITEIYTNYGTSFETLGENLPFVNIGKNVNVIQISCGSSHVCARLEDGGMKCLGYNQYGQTGVGSIKNSIGEASKQVGDALPFVNLGSGLQALQITTGELHTCAKVTGGLLKCFGNNSVGQLGLRNPQAYGKDAKDMGDSLPYVNLGTNVAVSSIHSGSNADHTCAVLSSPSNSTQRMKCWGDNFASQLGYGDTNNYGPRGEQMGDNLPLVDLGVESRVKQISLGRMYTCTLLVNDDLKCFGFNYKGNLGIATNELPDKLFGDDLPAASIGNGTIFSLATGNSHTCIVYDDQVTLKCVGKNKVGQLGQGDTVGRGDTKATTFENLPGVNLGTGNLKISSIYAGMEFTCVVFVDSSIKCFGRNSNGQCAAGTQEIIGTKKADMGLNLKFAGLLKASASEYGTLPPTPAKVVDYVTQSPTRSSAQTTFHGSIFAIFTILASMIIQF